MKGGATGGGHAQVVPMDEINLHFTGDFHAITSAHNLLAAMIDNHMYWGNALRLDQRRVAWRRVLDMNDRALRETIVGLGAGNGFPREDGFDITVASEVMAAFCLATSLEELEEQLGRMVVGWARDRQTGQRLRSQRAWRHDGAPQGGAQAQSRANARSFARAWCTAARSPTSPTVAIP